MTNRVWYDRGGLSSADELPIDHGEIRRIYARLAEDVLVREDRLRDELPIEATAGIHAHVRSLVENWKTGRKSLRTVPVANVYSRLERSVDPSLRRTLAGLDAIVNVLDDVIDTRDLATETRIGLTVNAAFSAVLLTENAPRGNRTEVRDVLRDYFTALFQIPTVEAELFETMERARTDRNEAIAAERIYAYRARDIDALVRLPAVTIGVGPETERRLLPDLRAYRARRLLFKDIRDVERDVEDGDVTPVVHFLRTRDSIDDTATVIEELYRSFEYTDAGHEQYGTSFGNWRTRSRISPRRYGAPEPTSRASPRDRPAGR